MVVFPCNVRASWLLPLICASSVACGSDRSPAPGGGASTDAPDGAITSPNGSSSGASEGTLPNGSSPSGSTLGGTNDSTSSPPPGPSSTTTPDTTTNSLPTQPMAGPLTLGGSPLVFTPTASAFSVSVVLTTGDPAYLRARVRKAGTEAWSDVRALEVREVDLGEYRFTGLEAATRYEYQILDAEADELRVLFDGRALTQRAAGSDFTFAMISDTHIGVNLNYSNQGDAAVTAQISSELLESDPDFLVHLGDVLDYHQFGFNVPPSDPILSRWAYQNYRGAMGNTIGQIAHFSAIGNWDGENGEFTSPEIARSRGQRMLYLPNASPDTYPQGGSPGQDYYAFTWGDATFVVLNVMSYTLTPHLLTGVNEFADDWTLGAEQLAWLEKTLSEATTKWKFTFIHHTVGGGGPNFANAAYGRGGGQAAKVGEQAIIHQMLLDYGVQVFFYGHDHVFVDMTVDGVHYTDPGSAGAPWKFETVETGYTEYWTDSGWSRVNVSPDAVHVEFLARGGALLHQYWIPERPDSGSPEVTGSDATSGATSDGTASEPGAASGDGMAAGSDAPDASL